MDYAKQSELLAGPMGLLKYSLTRFGTSISDDCVQILGGRGLTVGGLGQYIEQFNRNFKFDSARPESSARPLTLAVARRLGGGESDRSLAHR